MFRGEAGAAFADRCRHAQALYLRLLLAGFLIAPRGMGAIPTIATEQDVDDLADAIGQVLVEMERAGEPALAR